MVTFGTDQELPDSGAVRANFGPGPFGPILALGRSGQFWPWAVWGPIRLTHRFVISRLTHICVSLTADSYICHIMADPYICHLTAEADPYTVSYTHLTLPTILRV